jgi:TonB family protein
MTKESLFILGASLLVLAACQSSPKRIPTVRAAPLVSAEVAQRKSDGQVTASFVITNGGSVEDITIVSSDPAGLYDQAVVDAIRKWKYRPTSASAGEALPPPTMVHFYFYFSGCPTPADTPGEEQIKLCAKPIR